MKHTRIKLAGQWFLLAGSLLGALVLAGTSMYISVSFGLKASVLLAIVFGAADFLKIYMPLSGAAQGGMKGWQKGIWGIALVLALTAAVFHLLEMQSDRLQHTLSGNRQIENTRADEDLLRKRLADIAETMSLADAKVLYEKADKAHADAEAVVKKAGIKCDERKTCREAAKVAILASERLSAANARDELQAKLAAIKPATAETKVETFGPAKALASITGWNEELTASITMLILSVLAIILLEFGTAGLALDAGKRIAQMAKTLDGTKIQVKVTMTETTQTMGKDDVLKALQAAYLGAEEMPSTRELARRFGKSNSTLAGWIAVWKAEGLLPEKPVKLRVVS